ncbi:MAG TPA: nodulation protein NfeD [Gaiellaceae bacterium]|nr:nodulation protein NfeD [Gaiellaceae bacterium]
MKAALLRAFLASSVVAAAVFLQVGPAAAAAPARVLAVSFDNKEVNPVTARYVTREIDRANDDHYAAVVLVLDTPGGLSESMRTIYKKELASKVPVVVYVSPDGSRAASAGVWISQAADVLAMAPQTNIGSSTPIDVSGANIQSDLRRKVINDAAASLQALAKSHHRNVQWAADAVRVASNLPAYEALQRNVIDVVAPTLPALLKKIDGYKTVPKGLVLHTAGAQITTVHMSLWQRILYTLIDPNLIALFLSLGVLGIVIELWHPGLIFPATFGVLSLAIAFYGLDVLPISWAGLLLMLAAFAFWITELFIAFSHGALTVAGAVCFVFGSLLLFEPAGSSFQVSLPVALSIAGAFSLFFAFALAKVVQIRRRPAAVGTQTILGARGEVRRDGLVAVRGELWQARAEDGGELALGDEVEVLGVDGLSLIVRRAGRPLVHT